MASRGVAFAQDDDPQVGQRRDLPGAVACLARGGQHLFGLLPRGSRPAAVIPAVRGVPAPFAAAARAATPSTRNSRGPSRRCRRASGHRDRTRSSSRASAGSSVQTSRQSTDRSPDCSTDSPSGSTKDRFPFPSPNRPSSLPRNPRVLRRAWILVAGVEQRPPFDDDLPAGHVADALPVAGIALARRRQPDDQAAVVGFGFAEDPAVQGHFTPVDDLHPRRLLVEDPSRTHSPIRSAGPVQVHASPPRRLVDCSGRCCRARNRRARSDDRAANEVASTRGRVAADQQAGVMAAEAEAVGHDVVDAGLAGDVGDVVEVAAFAGVVEVDRGGKDAGVDGQGRGDQLDAAGGAQEVAELALGAGDLEPRRRGGRRRASWRGSRPGRPAGCWCRGR